MADIFISYASEDRERAKQIAAALSAQGWSVWWDREIPFGQNFDKVIEENLAAAKCVIVLWTRHSVTSRWVRTEASEGVGRDMLVPALLEADLKLPLEFKRLQAANLATWQPEEPHEEFQRLLKRIESLLGSTSRKHPYPPARSTNRHDESSGAVPRAKISKQGFYVFGLLVLPSAIIVAAAFGLMSWRMPTRVEIDVVVDRIAFSIAGSQPVPILDRPIGFQSISVESFDSITFTPLKLQIADANRAEESTTDVHWNAIAVQEAVVLRGRKQDLPIVTLTGDHSGAGPAGRLEAISVDPGTRVILEAIGGTGITMRFEGQRLAPAVMPLGVMRLNAARIQTEGALANAVQRGASLIALRVELTQDSPLIDVRSLPQALVLTINPAIDSTRELLSKTGAPIQDIELTRQNESGGREPSLVAPAEIRYPDFPAKEKIVIDSHDFLGLDKLNRFYISELEVAPDGKKIRLRLAGIAGHIQTLAGAVREDRRLTRFDALWYGSKPTVLFSILVWVFSVTFGAYKLYKEFKQ